MASALHAFLLDAKLSQYTEEITKLGATEVADLAEADDSELKAIGMTPVEVKRLRRKAAAATDSTTATAGVGSVIQAGGGGGQMLVPATGSTQWTYLDGTGAEHGPFAVAQLQEWYRAGQLTMDRKLRPAGGAGGFLPLSSIAELVSQLQSGQQPTQQLGQPTMQVVHAQAPAVHAAVTTAAHAPAPEPQPTVPEGVPPTFNKEVVQQTF
jgi:hypothetical protein